MKLIYRLLWVFIALNGTAFVGLNAYASHAKRFVDYPQFLTIFESATTQHAIHVLALLAIAVVSLMRPSRWLVMSAGFFTLGIVLFSYTLYLFSVTGVKIAGFLTPIGGVCFMLGWLSLIGIAFTKTSPAAERINE